MKKLALLGSTGSIGTQALDVVRCIQKEGEHAVKVEALAAHSNIRLLEEQIREFKPQAVAVFDLEAASKLRAAVRDLDVKVYSGMEGLCALTELESVDIVLNSVVGMVGLKPTLTALEAKNRIPAGKVAAGFYGRDAFAQHTAGMGEPKRHDVGVHGGIGICFKVAV